MKGITFTDLEPIEVRCGCHKLLFTVVGLGCIIRIVCPRCGKLNQWPILEASQETK